MGRSRAWLAVLLMAAACGAEPPEEGPASGDTAGGGSGDCLILAWQDQAAPDREFDRANDLVNGGAISCATGTTASRFEAALAAIREAAAGRDRARLLEQLDIPLLYIDGEGRRRQLTRAEAVDEVFDELFTPATLARLERVALDDLTVVTGEGAFLELGAIWLVVDRRGGDPRIVTVNVQALSEAAEAARRAGAPQD